MDGINWGGLVNRTNPFASFSEGLQQGSQMRYDQERQNLFRQEQEARMAERTEKARADRENRLETGIVGHMAKTDPRAAQAKAVEVGQYELADQIGKLTAEQRKVAEEHADSIATALLPLKDMPPEKAAEMWAQMKPWFAQRGFPEESLSIDFNQPGIVQAHISEATTLKDALAQRNVEADDRRADGQAAEARRHNSVTEKQGAARVGIAQGQLGIARSNSARGWASHNARVKAGGYGTPGVGGVVADDDVEIDP